MPRPFKIVRNVFDRIDRTKSPYSTGEELVIKETGEKGTISGFAESKNEESIYYDISVNNCINKYNQKIL